MQFGFTSQQLKSGNQSDESVKMIAVKVRNKHLLDPCKFHFAFPKRYLCAFTTINQEQVLFGFQKLRRGIVKSTWCGRIATEYSEGHSENVSGLKKCFRKSTNYKRLKK